MTNREAQGPPGFASARWRGIPADFRHPHRCGVATAHWRPAHGPLGFPLFLRPPGASLSPANTTCRNRANAQAHTRFWERLPRRGPYFSFGMAASDHRGRASLSRWPPRIIEAVLHLRSAAMDGRWWTIPKPGHHKQQLGPSRWQRSRTDRKNEGAPTDAGRPLNSGHRRARIRRASVGVYDQCSIFRASTGPAPW